MLDEPSVGCANATWRELKVEDRSGAKWNLSGLLAAEPSLPRGTGRTAVPRARTSHIKVGEVLRAQGDLVGALEAYRQSLAVTRVLAEARSDVYVPYLANSLSSLVTRLSEVGQLQEALAVSREAVALYRRVVETRPDALPDLARSLIELSDLLSKSGDQSDALAASEEAGAIQRRSLSGDHR
jgi:tetratricopeptide (TPR) repeat protein